MKTYFAGTIDHKSSYTRINLLLAALVVVATLSGGLVWGVQAHKNDQPLITTVNRQSPPSLAKLWQRPRQPAFAGMFSPGLPTSFTPGRNGAVCVPPGTVYVDDDWAAATPGSDPDGIGPATDFGCDSFATIHEGVTGVAAGGTVLVAAGNYPESQIIISKGITIQGAGPAVTTIDGGNFVIVSAAGSGPGTIFINQTDATSPVTIDGFTFVNPSIWADNGNQVTSIATLQVLAPVTISHNHFVGVATATSDLFDNAIWMYLSAGGGVANITDNEFEHSWQSIFLEVPVPGAVITGNSFHDLFATGAFPSQAMSLWTYGGQDVTAPVTISTNTFASSAGWSIVLRGGGAPLIPGGTENAQFLNDVTITGNLINTDGAGIVLRNPATNVSDPISGADHDGIVGATISDNTITSITPGTGTGIWLRGPNNNTTVTSNSIRGFASGILSEPYNAPVTSTGVAAHVNAIVGNTIGISNQGATSIDGQNNWWGCNAGPGMAGCDLVTGVVDFDPWLVLGVSASPNPIAPGGTSTVTADMTHNSDAADTSALGTVPSIPVAFSATEGTMLPVAGTIENGQETSVFTSTTNSNGTACATVDGQLTCTNVLLSEVTVTSAASPTSTDNDYTRINNAVQAAFDGQTITLLGTFDWTEPFAAASWAAGSNGVAGDIDDYSIYPAANLNNVTFTADNLGDATIQGPGDLATFDLEAVFYFDGGDNQNWTISNIRFLDFDNPIGMYFGAGGADAFNGTHITNNYIRLPEDLNATVAPGDVASNIGIHYACGTNQIISGNTIDIPGDAVSDSANSNFATDVAMQSNATGGSTYDGLQITNNTIHVLNAPAADPEVVRGIWENGNAQLSNITVSGNSFTNVGAGNNPATNLQQGFRITSHSSATTTVTYQNNTVSGANIGFEWLPGQNYAGNLPVVMKSNTITGNGTGVLLQSQGVVNLSFNRIVGNTTGLNNVDGIAAAENNWWGCNAGPGMAGCDLVTGVADFDPWIKLLVSAAPSALNPGGSSTITADMTHNSDGVDTSGSGTIPSTPVAFTATEGTMSPTAGMITAGQATSMFTSTSGNSGSACATVDNQETCTPLGVTEPSFAVDDVAHFEGDAGTTSFTFTVTKSGTTGLNSSVNFITQDGSATIANADYQTDAGTLNFGPTDTTMQFTVMVNGDLSNEPAELFRVTLSSPVNATISRGDGGGLVQNDDGPTAAEGTISGQIRDGSGMPVEGVTIQLEGTQSRRIITDKEGKYQFDRIQAGGFYTVTPSRVNFTFNPGQRSFSQLGDHTDAAFTAMTTGGALNPLDTSEYFVRQQYLDFLGREPDEAGFNFWVNNIAACGTDSSCLAVKRSDTSAAFFLSIEFQQTGYLVYRIYQSAYSNRPGAPIPLTLAEFNPDTAAISNGVIVNADGWEAKLETNKQAFAAAFVARSRFTSAYPIAMTPGEFVDRLFTSAGVTPDAGDRTEAVNQFAGATDTADASARGRALRLVAENATLRQQDFNQAFVLMQYFGYLGRDPNASPDGDFSGYNFWLSKLDSFGGDFRRAEMVEAFLVAGEYRGRFPR